MQLIHQYKLYKAVLMLLLVFMVSSCSKSFLEINPKGKLIADKVADYDLLLNSTDLVDLGGGNAQVFLSDEVAMAEPYFSSTEPRSERLFKWQPLIYEQSEDALETAPLLRQLYLYNKIINEIGSAADGTAEQRNSIKAEAQGGRAWVNFYLVNYFGKQYNSATAATDLAFPLIMDADVTATKFERATVKQLYDLIVKDLTEAIPHLPLKIVHRYRMAAPAAEALLGKVYMFMGRFEEALPLLTNSINHLSNQDLPVEIVDYNLALAPGGEYMPIDIFGPSTPALDRDAEAVYGRRFSNFWILNSDLVISAETLSLFRNSDLRLQFYSDMPFPAGPVYQAGVMRRTGPLTTNCGVSVPELYLLRAECYARANQLILCKQDLEALRSKRMPAADAAIPASIENQQLPMLKFVFEERIREFASTGYRWWDMRRLTVDPHIQTNAFTHKIYAEDGSVEEFSLPAERLVLKMPAKILGENPGMPDNP